MNSSELIARMCVVASFVMAPASAKADAFTPPPGWIWGKIGVTTWRADEIFAGPSRRDPSDGVEVGARVPFDKRTLGRLQTDTLTLNLEAVPVKGLRLGVFAPVRQRAFFEDTEFTSETLGPGDARLYTGVQLGRTERFATELTGRVKIPLTTLPQELDTVPLGEGQLDLAIQQQTTWVLGSRLRASWRMLYRHRRPFVDEEAGRALKPGDEFELQATLGASVASWLWLTGSVGGLWATAAEDRSSSGAFLLVEKRQFQYATAGAYVSFGRWIHPSVSGLALDLYVQAPLLGQDYPAGPTYGVGLAWGGVVVAGGR